MRSVRAWLIGLLSVLSVLGAAGAAAAQGRFEVSFPASLRKEPLTGRLLIIVSRSDKGEPRQQLGITGPPGVIGGGPL